MVKKPVIQSNPKTLVAVMVAGVFHLGGLTMPIQVICAWCQRDIGTKEGEALCSVSHGICTECAQKVQMEIKEFSQRKKQSEEIKETFYSNTI